MRLSRLPLLALALAASSAGAQTVIASNGVTHTTPALAGFVTSGDDMGGMLVTAYFSNGSSSAGSWADLGGGTWGVSNGLFSLTLGAGTDTFGGDWSLSNSNASSLTRFVLNGSPGITVFDRALPSEGTPGSASGLDFVFVSGGLAGSTALYTNIVNLTGFPAVGDIYETLDVELGSGGLGTGATLTFEADTDNARAGASITPVPEPATYALVAAGLLALGGVARRRRTA